MALLYDPGQFMPRHELDFAGSSWLMSWPDGPWHMHDLEIGGTVFLVNSGPAQRIVWETRVTHSFAVPYEAVGDLASEILRRWGLVVDVANMVPGGFAIGWRAEPVARVDRGPINVAARFAVGAETMTLTGQQFSADESEAFHRRWGLPADAHVFCSGRPLLGWLGPSSNPRGHNG